MHFSYLQNLFKGCAQCWVQNAVAMILNSLRYATTTGARGEGLSGLEGLLAVVGLDVTTEGIGTGTGKEK